MGRERALVWETCGTGGHSRLGEGPGHSPVQLGVLHQRVGVPITDESPACEADEALGVVLQLPGHLAGCVGRTNQLSSHLQPPYLFPSQKGSPKKLWEPGRPDAEIPDRAGF